VADGNASTRPPTRHHAAFARRRIFLLLVVVAVVVIAAVVLGLRHKSSIPGLASAQADTQGVAVDPAAFSTGACMSFPPTHGDRHLTVFLDAGHGGIDPGGVGTTENGKTIYEADETLPVELDVMALLRAKGFQVVVSRTGATSVVKLTPADTDQGVLSLVGAHDDVAARDVCANDADADLLVGIYYDAGGSADNAGGLTAYDADRPFTTSNLRLANLLQADVLADLNAKGWGIPNDGVMPDDSLGSYVGDPSGGGIAAEAASYDHLLLIGPAQSGFFTTPSQMPGAVIEPLYITDPFEGSIAASTTGQQTIADGIAQAVEQYFPVKPTSKATSTTG
jgi:N-acetylmuramoyl-L-alanine amidase